MIGLEFLIWNRNRIVYWFWIGTQSLVKFQKDLLIWRDLETRELIDTSRREMKGKPIGLEGQ